MASLTLFFGEPTCICSCFRIVFIFSILFGLVPFHVTTTLPCRLRSSPWGYVNMVARMIIYTFAFVYSMTKEQSVLALFLHTHLSQVTDGLQKFNGMFGVLVVLIIGLAKRAHLMHLVLSFSALEKRFFNVGLSFEHAFSARRINYFLWCVLGANLSYIFFSDLGILSRSGASLKLPAFISFYSPHVIVSGISVLFVSFSYKISQYFDALHQVLKNLYQQWENRPVKTISQKQRPMQCLDSFSMYTIVTKNPTEIIQESMEIHMMICEAASTANKYFTYQLLTIISIAFLIIVFDAYYVLETLLGKSQRESKFKTVEFVTFFSCQMILYLIAIISIVEGSNRAIKKSEKTGGIVHTLLNKAKNPEIKEKLQQFSMQLMHLKINFTAAGLFNIDRTLYFTISGALTTYLIILLQFTSNPPMAVKESAIGPAANRTD